MQAPLQALPGYQNIKAADVVEVGEVAKIEATARQLGWRVLGLLGKQDELLAAVKVGLAPNPAFTNKRFKSFAVTDIPTSVRVNKLTSPDDRPELRGITLKPMTLDCPFPAHP